MTPGIVGANIDTLILNIKGALRPELDHDLDRWKQASQETDEDLATPWTFVGQPLYIRAHGSGRQWRWILHCPSLHLDIGRGRLNGIIGKARLASVFLWEQGPEAALALLYVFLAGFYGEGFTLQVGEVHPCVDVVGWELALQEAVAFLTRGHHRTPHLLADETDDDPTPWLAPALDIQLSGRRCKGFDFSRGAAHACCIYDKTLELTVSHKAWMEAVWQANGWDGQSRVTRVEFRYRRECLREMGVEEAYAFFDQLPSLWAVFECSCLRGGRCRR